jgi:hypothetical protein
MANEITSHIAQEDSGRSPRVGHRRRWLPVLLGISFVLALACLPQLDDLREINLGSGAKRRSVRLFGHAIFQTSLPADFNQRFRADLGPSSTWVEYGSCAWFGGSAAQYRRGQPACALEEFAQMLDHCDCDPSDALRLAKTMLAFVERGERISALYESGEIVLRAGGMRMIDHMRCALR